MDKPIYLAHNSWKVYGMFAAKPYKIGDVILKFSGEILLYDMCDEHSMRITEDFSLQYESSGSSECFINHSCDPNCFISFFTGIPNLVAIKDIKKDEELFYDYNTTNLRIEGFYCKCGSAKCKRQIKGYDFLTPADQKEINRYLSPYIRSIIDKKVLI